MRNNIIAFGLLALILTAELWAIAVNGDGFYQALVGIGECRGITTQYDSTWGISRWDCDGNRLPDERSDNVDAQISRDPQADIVRNSPAVVGTPRERPRRAEEATPGWEY
jgi:hypothetical protein